jgi:HEPN domain-containing protein
MAGSSPSPEALEVAELLAGIARDDLRATETLAGDPAIGERAVGLHAQQAVEKALKVALTLAGCDFPRTHDIEFLVRLAQGEGIAVPPAIQAAGWLTQWAGEFRYDDVPLDTLERDAAIRVAAEAVEWGDALLAASQP